MTLTPEQRQGRLELLRAAIAVEKRKKELGTPRRGDNHRYSYFGKRVVKLR